MPTAAAFFFQKKVSGIERMWRFEAHRWLSKYEGSKELEIYLQPVHYEGPPLRPSVFFFNISEHAGGERRGPAASI